MRAWLLVRYTIVARITSYGSVGLVSWPSGGAIASDVAQLPEHVGHVSLPAGRRPGEVTLPDRCGRAPGGPRSHVDARQHVHEIDDRLERREVGPLEGPDPCRAVAQEGAGLG